MWRILQWLITHPLFSQTIAIDPISSLSWVTFFFPCKYLSCIVLVLCTLASCFSFSVWSLFIVVEKMTVHRFIITNNLILHRFISSSSSILRKECFDRVFKIVFRFFLLESLLSWNIFFEALILCFLLKIRERLIWNVSKYIL